MEIGNVSTRQQPDQTAENSKRLPMGLQHSENSRTRRRDSAVP